MYSLPFGIAVSLQLLSNYFDKIVSVTLLSPTDYAIYSAAFLSIPGVSQLYDSLAQVNIINMSKCYQAEENEKIIPLYKGFVQKTLSFSIPIIFAVALYAEEIIGFLFTEQYNAAAKYFRIYSLTFLVTMFGAGTILRSINKTNLSMYTFLISCTIGLPLTYYLIKNFGVNGALMAAVVNIVLPRIIQMLFEIKVMREKITNYLPWWNIARMLCIAVASLFPLFLAKFHGIPFMIDMILAVFYILAVYLIYLKLGLFIIREETLKHYLIRIRTAIYK